MAKENDWLISVGIEPDSAQNQQAAQRMLEQLRQEINKNFKLDIPEGAFDKIIQAAEKLGTRVTVFKDAKGDITSLSASFKSTNDQIVTLNTSLDTTRRKLSDIAEEVAGNKNSPFKLRKDGGINLNSISSSLFKQGLILDSKGNSITGREKGRASEILSVEASKTSVSYSNKDTYVLDEIKKRYKEIESLQKQMSGSNWEDVAKKIATARQELDDYIKANKKVIDETGLKDIKTSYEGTKSTAGSINTTAYNEVLQIINKIQDVKLKMSTADRDDLVLLEQKLSSLEKQKQAIEESAKLTSEQKKNVKTQEDESKKTVERIGYIKELETAEKQLENNYKQQLATYNELNRAKRSGNETAVALQEESLKSLQKEETALKGNIESLSKTAKVKNNLVEIEKEYTTQREKQTKQQAVVDDNDKIQEAINLKKQLLSAELELYKLQSKKAPSQDLEDQRREVNRLRTALDDATKAQLSNNTAVGDSAKYTEKAADYTRQQEQEMRKLNVTNQQSVGILSNVSNGFRDVSSQVQQYIGSLFSLSTAQRVLGEVIDTVKELDEEMTNVRLVTGQSSEEARQLMNDYSGLAKELGVTTKTVAEG